MIVLGASFAGIELVRRLRRDSFGRRLSITVVDRQVLHPYIPLVHERLAERIPPANTVLATAERLAGLPNVRFVHDEVVAMESAQHRVELASGEHLRGRFVVVALGSVLGVLALSRVAVWGTWGAYGEHFIALAVVAGLSVIGCVLCGTLAGAMLPFVLKKFGADPASASAPFVATLVDVSGILIYFAIANLVLRGILL